MHPHVVLIISLAGSSLLLSTQAIAQQWSLSVQPTKCVSLNQGNVCYQDVQLQWQAAQPADYCVYRQGGDEPIKCWQQSQQGQIAFEFAETQTQHYVLKRLGDDQTLATSKIEVKWVYKGRRSNRFGWRVF